MKQSIAHISLIVNDYDKAIAFYTQKLDFKLIEDIAMSETKRWVLIAPPGAKETSIVLAKATSEEQQKSIGNQTGGRVFLFLSTDDVMRDYKNMVNKKVKFTQIPTVLPHGTVAIFEDLYGNLWDLIQPNK